MTRSNTKLLSASEHVAFEYEMMNEAIKEMIIASKKGNHILQA